MRLDLQAGDRTVVLVTLSERNLLSLLQKLRMPGSARAISSAHAYRDGELVDDVVLVVQAEPDADHYARRGFGPGRMHPSTEAFLAARLRRKNGW